MYITKQLFNCAAAMMLGSTFLNSDISYSSIEFDDANETDPYIHEIELNESIYPFNAEDNSFYGTDSNFQISDFSPDSPDLFEQSEAENNELKSQMEFQKTSEDKTPGHEKTEEIKEFENNDSSFNDELLKAHQATLNTIEVEDKVQDILINEPDPEIHSNETNEIYERQKENNEIDSCAIENEQNENVQIDVYREEPRYFGTWVYYPQHIFPHISLDIYSLRASVSHTQGRGIGYRRGYTSLDFFFIPSFCQHTAIYPFIDIRGHGMNDRKLAANIGVGFRYQATSPWIFGANLYYDTRQGIHKGFDSIGYFFKQIGIGVEALGPHWDIRANFYLPIGKKIWETTQIFFTDNAGVTPNFITKHQYAMRGADAEIGRCFAKGSFCNCCMDWKTYFAIGGYYLEQEHRTGFWGAKARVSASLGRYFFFELRGSYDEKNLTAIQFKVGIDLPLYPETSFTKQIQNCEVDCCTLRRRRLSQPVVRAEIMPLKTKSGSVILGVPPQ